MKFYVQAPDFGQLSKHIQAALDRAVEKAAAELPKHICRQLKKGRKPNGDKQPKLKRETYKQKRRGGFRSTPGVRTGVMTDPASWQVGEVARSGGGRAFEIRPPAEREDVPRYLERQGFVFLGFPDSWRKRLQAHLRRELRDLKARLAGRRGGL